MWTAMAPSPTAEATRFTLAGGQPFHITEVNAYLLRVPHSLRGWQRVRVLKFRS